MFFKKKITKKIENKRRLQFENLERRDLMSADLEWPLGVGLAADIYEDGGYKLSQNKLGAEVAELGLSRESLATSGYYTTRYAIGGNSDDLNGALLFPDGQPRVAVVYHNGGQATPHQSALGNSGKQAYVEFVNIGGSYVGSCAGLWTAKNLGLYPGGASQSGGSGTQIVKFEDDGNPVSELLKEKGLPLTLTVSHYGGPALQPWNSKPEEAEFWGKVVGGYPSRTRGSEIIVSYQPDDGSGMRVLTTSHPEYSRTEAQTIVMAAMLQHAYKNSKVTPDIKGEILYNQSIVMNNANQKIGDKQYHRYIVNIEPGTPQLAITTGDATKTEIYASSSSISYAGNSQYSGDDLIIQNPEPGQWEISILGDHTIKNGVPYTLYVGSELPIIEQPNIGQRIADIAWAELGKSISYVGTSWGTGALRASGLAGIPSSQWAYLWCSEFLSGVYHEAGIDMSGGYYSSKPWMLTGYPQIIKWFQTERQFIWKGNTGWDTIKLSPGDYLYTKGHSALVYSVSDDGETITTIEGNHGNRVGTRTITNWRSSIILGVGILNT